MIYIDPPYNTGNDFIYEDDFSQNVDDYIAGSGQLDEEGNRLVQNTERNGRFHTDWLNMIYPRLRLAKDLLSEDGVIFISIDDNEVDNLKKVCNEIFGAKNYVANLIWQSTPGSNTGNDVKTVTENVLLYSKNRNDCKFAEQEISDTDKYTGRDEYYERRGGYVLNKLDRRMTGQHYSDALNYSISMPDGMELFPGNSTTKQEHWNWRWSKSKVEWGIKNDFIVMKKNEDTWSIYFKQYENVNNEDVVIKRTLSYQNLLNIDGANSARGTREVMQIFDGKYFDYPKPLNLILHLVKMVKGDSFTFLDFFSGSATTAHAVMQLNAEDGGHRKFIMVQLPEETSEKSEAYKAGYRTICEIGEERIRRAGKKIKEETGADIDYGFRVFKVDSSNMEDVYYKASDYNQEQMELFANNIKADRTPEDLLFQVMLDLGVLLSSKIEENEIAGKKVFNVAEGFLLACFDENVTEETVKAVAEKKPYYAVFRDSSMANDSVATNFEQIFETISPETVRKVL
jgi:adenine-specific DNA-methyltransferase